MKVQLGVILLKFYSIVLTATLLDYFFSYTTLLLVTACTEPHWLGYTQNPPEMPMFGLGIITTCQPQLQSKRYAPQ